MNTQKLHALLRRHPFASRLVVTAMIALAVASVLAALGMRSLLMSGVAALVAVPAAFVALCTREERQQAAQLVEAAAQSALEHWRPVVGVAVWVALIAYFQCTRSEPAQPAVRLVFDIVNAFGAMAALGVPVFRWVSRSVSGHPTSIGLVMGQLLRGVAFYSLALWLIGEVGDTVYAVVVADLNKAAAVAAAVAIIWLIVEHPLRRAPEPRAAALDGGTRQARLSTHNPERTSVHEAGHVLVYAALGDIPREADVRAVVRSSPTSADVHGSVSAIFSGQCLEEPTFVEWRMLVLLAGKRAEMAACGSASLGSSGDYDGWLDYARLYLANHIRGIYYRVPANKFEQLRNEAQLEALKAEQEAMLDAFFALNAEVLRDLANALLLAGAMDRAALMPFLDRVKLPAAFPRPLGAFDSFGEDSRAAAGSASTGAQGGPG